MFGHLCFGFLRALSPPVVRLSGYLIIKEFLSRRSSPLLPASDSGVQKYLLEPGRNKRRWSKMCEFSCDAAACFTLDRMKEFHMKRWTMVSPSLRLCSVCLYMKKLKDTGGFWEGARRCVRMRLAAEDEAIQEGRPGGFFVFSFGD